MNIFKRYIQHTTTKADITRANSQQRIMLYNVLPYILYTSGIRIVTNEGSDMETKLINVKLIRAIRKDATFSIHAGGGKHNNETYLVNMTQLASCAGY